MVLLENDTFLSKLTLMLDKARTKGHVDICMKRYDGRTKPVPRQEPVPSSSAASKKNRTSSSSSSSKTRSESTSAGEGEFMCLVRAKLKNEKISSVVHARDVNKFQLAYCNLLKSNMDGLKRQKKIKLKKATQ